MRTRRLLLPLVFALCWASLALGTTEARAYTFPRVAMLEPNVAFWRNVYAVWSENEIAFHDRQDMRLIYRVIKVPSKKDPAGRRAAIVKGKNELVAALRSLNKKRPKSAKGLSGVELEVFEKLKAIKRDDKYRRLGTMRAQNGLRERFVTGWEAAGAFEPQIRERLKVAGLPEDIVALAYLESLMDLRARSHAGAVGPWQFMKPTAREYMYVNGVVDERMDPILSADAAAKYLNTALKEVGPWPVAITSYNYGRSGMRRAIKATGSNDFGKILRNFKSKRFGLAARNYYASFLAVHDVIMAPEKFFPGLTQVKPWDYEIVRLPFGVLASQLEKSGAISARDLEYLNPGLTQAAREGTALLPQGLPLRVPAAERDRFVLAVLSLSDDDRVKALTRVKAWHRSSGGESVRQIAKRYRANPEMVARMNGLATRSRPKKGRRIAVPQAGAKYSLFPDAKALPVPPASPVEDPKVAAQRPPAAPLDEEEPDKAKSSKKKKKKRTSRRKNQRRRRSRAGG